MPLKTRLKPKCHDGINFGLKKETRQTFGLHEHSRIGPTKTKSATSLEVNISRLPGVFEHHVFKDRKNLWGIRGTSLPRTLDGGNPYSLRFFKTGNQTQTNRCANCINVGRFAECLQTINV